MKPSEGCGMDGAGTQDTGIATQGLVDRLGQIAARARWLLIAERAGWIIGASVLALIVGGALDYVLRAPNWLRTLGLFGAMGLCGLAIVRWLIPALRFRPSMTEVALRVEASGAGKTAQLRDVLAAAIDLGRPGSGEVAMSGPVVARASAGMSRLESSSVLVTTGSRQATGFSVVGVLALVAMLVVAPGLAGTGLSRMLWPWGGAEWPKREAIVDVTGVRVHPFGSALALRGALVGREAGAIPSGTRLTARFRLRVDGTAGAMNRVVLTSQERQVSFGENEADAGRSGGSVGTKSGVLFERLIEPNTLRPVQQGQIGLKSEGQAGPLPVSRFVELEYSIASGDDESAWTRIKLVEPPTVVGAKLSVRLPGYIGEGAGRREFELGPGIDERAVPPAMLVGTRAALRIEFGGGGAVLPPKYQTEGVPDGAWVAQMLGQDAAKLFESAASDAWLSAEAKVWTLSWIVQAPLRLVVRPTDEYGIGASEDALYRLESLTDNPPTVSVTLPASDQSVLPTAVVEVRGEARDDVALSQVSIERQIARRPDVASGGLEGGRARGAGADGGRSSGSGQAVPDPGVPAAVLSVKSVGEINQAGSDAGAGESGKVLTASATLDLGELGVKPGDEVWISAVAIDAYELDGQRHGPVRSSVRKLRVISRDELIEQVWGELGGVRRAAIRLDQEQQENQQTAAKPGESQARRAERAQAGISERLSRQEEAVADVQRQVEEAGLTEQSLKQAVRDAKAALEEAGKRSGAASKSLGQAAKAQEPAGESLPPPEAGAAERAEAQDKQAGVREELGKLIEMLDRGEDAFASKRAVERLLQQQRELRERTAEAAKQSAGKSPDQLTEQQQAQLNRIAQEQSAASEQMKQTVRGMQEREQKLRQTDPSASEAMSQAAKRAEREQVAQKMQKAAEQAQQNQVGQAQQQQQQAIRSMEQMLQDIDQAAKNRDETLRRALASLIDSIEGLIQVQSQQLALLDAAIGADVPAEGRDLAPAMQNLHQNTLGVIDQAQQATKEQRELASVVGLLEKAGVAQSQAIVELRGVPTKFKPARVNEQESVEQLKAAKAAAEKIDEQAADRQEARKRGELRKQYQQILEKQMSVKDGVDGLVGVEATRRTRAAARQLGLDQTSIKESLAELQRTTKELKDARVFDFAHRRLSEHMSESAGTLEQGVADAVAQRRQVSMIRTLRSMIESLDDKKKGDSPFRENQQSGGGGGSGQQPKLVPPSAELKLLRLMQIEAAELTRGVAEAGGVNKSAIEEASSLQGQLTEQAKELLKRVKREASGGDGAEEIKPEPKGEKQP